MAHGSKAASGQRTIREPERHTPVLEEVDVLVCGGGPAGVGAAAAAARAGMNVLLVERYGFLGGMATAGMSGTICGYYGMRDGEPIRLQSGIVQEFYEAMEARGALGPVTPFGGTVLVPHDPLQWRFVAEQLVLRAGARLLYHAWIADVVLEGNELRGIVVETKQGRAAVLARQVIDCTGDGDVAVRAGAPYWQGNRGRVQVPSMMFRLMGVDREALARTPVSEIHRMMEEAHRRGEFDLPRRDGWLFPSPRVSEVLCNLTAVKLDGRSWDGTVATDLTFGEVKGREQVIAYTEFLRRYVPAFRSAFLNDIGVQIGVRQTRSIQGEYVLTNQDVVDARKADDAIARSAWPIELHDVEDVRLVYLPDGDYYEIPYRALVPLNVENLLVAGRCFSAEHEAQASARVTAICMAQGQAAGVAAAMALGDSKTVRQLDGAAVREQLRSQGVEI